MTPWLWVSSQSCCPHRALRRLAGGLSAEQHVEETRDDVSMCLCRKVDPSFFSPPAQPLPRLLCCSEGRVGPRPDGDTFCPVSQGLCTLFRRQGHRPLTGGVGSPGVQWALNLGCNSFQVFQCICPRLISPSRRAWGESQTYSGHPPLLRSLRSHAGVHDPTADMTAVFHAWGEGVLAFAPHLHC